ncbi:hypothetical protein COCNU_16G003830 [Cocos nucifera]|uniref:protein-serine/threonine phosphatase n=1 Tax=Cocos nucifera TaxID=13894 RepID=A0A8K0IYE9_COCNU|nr:hypothetical protein COCNU_16G003830 [Cocos nucifera]
MRHLSLLFNGFAKSLYSGRGKLSGIDCGREAADELAREAKKNDMILKSSGTVRAKGSNSFVSVFSQRGEKGVNQDCSIVWEGELMVIANVGDSRAVLATTAEDGSLVPVQLTVEFKPNLPQEAERITRCKGRVFCLHDEPGVHRVWLPNEETPGLAMSRAFGDYCVKDYGLISVPEVTQRRITNRDRFIVLATDGVWDVISNQEAVQIVSSTKERGKSAKRLVKCAVRAWKRKRRGMAADDCSAICLFFDSSPPSVC